MAHQRLLQARPLVLLFLFCVACVLAGNPAIAATVPAGFSDTLFSGGLSAPTAMQFAPDGRLFVCEQGGTLRVIKNGALLPAPFVTVTVSSVGERGLLGVAFDPAFAVNQFVYVYYTATTPTIHNRISRFTANGDVAVGGSEVVILNLPTLGATNHNGGAITFGPDGKLYAAVGENAVGSNSQSLSTPLGKMLRLNANGTIPADNPFVATPGANPAVWAYGLRNPFTFAFDPGGSRMFINDVGELTWEEIDDGIAGANYGWNLSEGPTSNPAFTSPRYAYTHASGGCAITGGAFYSPVTDQFPSSYSGDYFFADFCGGWIRTLDPAAGNTVTNFASGISQPVDLKVSDDGDLYYLERGTGSVRRITWVATVTADSVTPASGSGSTQTFALRYTDTAGVTNITTAWVWFNPTFASSAANSCMSYYDRVSNTVSLLNDAGTAWMSAAVGGSGALQNSRCAIALGGTTVGVIGNTLTVNLAMTFTPMFAGAKNTYMYAANASGSGSGWQVRGAWTVPAGPVAVVTADTVTPASGSGASQVFALRYSDTAGATDLSMAWVWFNATFASTSANSCLAYYDRVSNTLSLLNDAGSGWMVAMVGAAGVLQNSQCTITLGSSTTVTPAGTALTLNLAMSFASMFAGPKNVYMYAVNGSGMNSGWQTRGAWTVSGAAPPPVAVVTADSVTPASGSGASQTFALQVSDTAGATDLATAWVWFNATFASTSANSCLAYYDRATNTVSLLNDGANAWMAAMVGSSGTLQNSQCAITLGGSTTAVVSGTTLTLNLAMTFAPMFAGAKNVYLYAASSGGMVSGWQMRGTWTATTGSAPVVTADSVTPASGTGASQTFALQLSDTAGATDLRMAWVWFNATFASTAANSCLAYYDRPSNTIYLLNDAGTIYVSGVVGAAGALMNSQCTITLGGSTTTVLSGNTLTLNLAMTFAPMFAGAKNVYLYASSAGGANSGWQTRGAWTVP